MDSEQSPCYDNIDNTEHRRDSVESGRDRPSSTGGDVILCMCVICGLHKPEPLSRSGHGTNTFQEHCTAAGKTSVVDFIRYNQHVVHGVHKSCKLDIFNKATKVAKLSIASDKHTAGRKRTRTSTVSFDFNELCFYCSKPTSECKRDEWHCVETLEMRETIMQPTISIAPGVAEHRQCEL